MDPLQDNLKITLDHLVLRVSNFDSASDFYRTLFTFSGFSEVSDPDDKRSVGFRAANGLTLWLEEFPNLIIGDSHGWLDHYALHCESRDEVDKAYQFCKTQEWKIISEPKAYPAYGNFYGFSFRGPDNLKLEFVTRAPTKKFVHPI